LGCELPVEFEREPTFRRRTIGLADQMFIDALSVRSTLIVDRRS